MKAKLRLVLWLILVGSGLTAGLVWYISGHGWYLPGFEPEVFIQLKELPNVSTDVLASQGMLFRVEEPFLFNRKTKMAVFVVEIYSTRNFEGETHLKFGGDAQSLQSFANEIRLVNSGPSRFGGAASGEVVPGNWTGRIVNPKSAQRSLCQRNDVSTVPI